MTESRGKRLATKARRHEEIIRQRAKRRGEEDKKVREEKVRRWEEEKVRRYEG